MSLNQNELNIEQEYLEQTLKVLRRLIGDDASSIEKDQSDIEEFKQYFWSSITDMDDMEKHVTRASINSQIDRTNDKIAQLNKLKRSLKSPYFGRVDFYIDGRDETKVYVGLNGVQEGLEFYVFDWRSPIGSLFYNYNIGPASYKAPVGDIRGEIKLKRQYKVEDGKLVRCFDSDMNIDDEYLQEILAKSSGDKMKNIVNTIQQEQNAIIRNDKDRLLIVQGIAGSGKTSVALHRIAYLLYHEKNLRSNNVLIFSPNDVFSKYISNVLPELGEENTMQSTFTSFAESYLKEFKEVESFTTFVERYYKDPNFDPELKRLIDFKQSDDLKFLLDAFITDYRSRIKVMGGIQIGQRVYTKEHLDSRLQYGPSKMGILDRIDQIAENICDELRIPISKYKKQIKKLIISKIRMPLDMKQIYQLFLNGLNNTTDMEIPKVSKSKLSYEDLLPYLYIKFELFGYPKNNGIRHVIIDEAQDYTRLQFAMLAKIFESSSFTILGDTNQTINPFYKHESLEPVGECFPHQPRYIELNKTYRSTEEIIDYSNKVLGLNNMVAVRHAAAPVEYKDVPTSVIPTNLLEDIETLQQKGSKRIAIITKTFDEAIITYEALKEQIPNVSLVTGETHAKLTNIMVMPSYLSKGLEFDGVIACTDEGNLYGDEDKYLYYVVCTRAQHHLVVYNQKTFKKDKPQKLTYEKK